MPRRKPAIDIFEQLSNAPWQLGVGVGVFFLIIGTAMGGATGSPAAMPIALIGVFVKIFGFVALAGAAASAIKQNRRRQLLDNQTDLPSLRSLSWREFEQLVGEAYRRQGYDVEETGGGGADGGIDLLLRGHGETVLVQCKQWRAQQVGVDKVRELFGVLTAERANRGILVTSGTFTNDAQSFKVGKPLILVDGPALAALVRDVRAPAARIGPPPIPTPHRATVQPSDSPTDMQPACPLCNAPMALRTARRGPNAGNQFYGCTRYPDGCRGTRPA